VTATRYYMHRVAAANCRVELATLMFENDMLPEAKAVLDAAAAEFEDMGLQKSYHFINILMGQASIAGETGRLDDAAAAYEELLTMAPNAEFYSDTMLMYVSALCTGKRCAIAVARRFFAALPSALSVSVLAAALMAAGEDEEALTLYEVARGASTADSVLHINCRFYLGELTQRAERDLEAIEHYVYVIRFQDHEKVAEAHRRLAQIFFKYEMTSQAQTMLAEAGRLNEQEAARSIV
jgi:tetratricopeptide (TPR) repeat protein